MNKLLIEAMNNIWVCKIWQVCHTQRISLYILAFLSQLLLFSGLGVGPEPEWKLPHRQDNIDLITTPRNNFKGKVDDKFSHTNMRFYPLILCLLIVPPNLCLLSPFPEVQIIAFPASRTQLIAWLFKEVSPGPHH